MNKNSRKELEQEIALAVEEILSRNGKEAAADTKKFVKSASKLLVKKFKKAVKKGEKKSKAPAKKAPVKKKAKPGKVAPAKKVKE
jgi:hypothetical protein